MAFQVRTQITGVERLRKKLRKIDKDLKKPIRQAVREGALKIQSDARVSIQRGGRSGRIYRVTKGGRLHQASGPGEPPKSITGTLANSIKFQVARDSLSAVIGTNLKYGKYLEFGTRNMKSRPWLLPAYKKNAKAVLGLIRDEVKRALEAQAVRHGGR